MRNLITLFFSIFVGFFLVAEIRPAFADGAASQFDFTQVQDLNPDALPSNRPINQKWLLIVGASKFKEKRIDSPSLMDRAAENFYQYATDPNAGRFDKDHTRLLVNGDATKHNIMASLGKSWLGTLAGPDDLVVVFVSTLSFPTTDGKSYLCAYDCALDNVYSTCISIQDFMDVLRKEVPAKRIVLILQSCYSGAAELTSGSKSIFGIRYNLDLDTVSLGKGFIILSSSQPDQITWSDSFSENLIKALRENNGMSDLNAAFERAKQGTEVDTRTTSNGLRCQTPIMKSDWHGKPLILGMPPLSHIAPQESKVGVFMAAESAYLKANQALIAGNLDDALTHYKEALAVDPNYADAWADYGSALSLQAKFPEALDAYRKAIALKPGDSLFHLNYARLLAKAGDWQGSVNELNESLRLDPKNRTALVALANVKMQSAEYGPAAEYLRKAIALYPASATLHDRLGYVLGRDGAAPEAIAESRQAVELDPKLLSARLNLAANILLSGDSDGALAAYRDTLKLDPDNADAHYCAGQILRKKGEASQANVELKKFLDVAKIDDPRRSEVQVQFNGAVGTVK